MNWAEKSENWDQQMRSFFERRFGNRDWIVWSLALIFLLWLNPLSEGFSFCLLNILDIPCPGCGIGKSMAALLDGKIGLSLKLHPLGWLALGVIVWHWLKTKNPDLSAYKMESA